MTAAGSVANCIEHRHHHYHPCLVNIFITMTTGKHSSSSSDTEHCMLRGSRL